MAEYYHEICELTLRYRDSKEVVVRRLVISLIPQMAVYDSEEFESRYLHRSMAYLLSALRKPTDREFAYVSLGHLAVRLQSKMRPFIGDLVEIIKEHLRSKG